VAKKVKEESKFVRLKDSAEQEKFIQFAKKVQDGELKWSHYALDGNFCYHYYRKLS
jgi:hypothetical protein